MVTEKRKQVAHRWYLGGIASAGAACGTHPLDLLKVSYIIFTCCYNKQQQLIGN